MANGVKKTIESVESNRQAMRRLQREIDNAVATNARIEGGRHRRPVNLMKKICKNKILFTVLAFFLLITVLLVLLFLSEVETISSSMAEEIQAVVNKLERAASLEEKKQVLENSSGEEIFQELKIARDEAREIKSSFLHECWLNQKTVISAATTGYRDQSYVYSKNVPVLIDDDRVIRSFKKEEDAEIVAQDNQDKDSVNFIQSSLSVSQVMDADLRKSKESFAERMINTDLGISVAAFPGFLNSSPEEIEKVMASLYEGLRSARPRKGEKLVTGEVKGRSQISTITSNNLSVLNKKATSNPATKKSLLRKLTCGIDQAVQQCNNLQDPFLQATKKSAEEDKRISKLIRNRCNLREEIIRVEQSMLVYVKAWTGLGQEKGRNWYLNKSWTAHTVQPLARKGPNDPDASFHDMTFLYRSRERQKYVTQEVMGSSQSSTTSKERTK